jgi:hypothetical protein
MRFFNVLAQGTGEIGNAALELVHGAMEFALVGFVVRKKCIEEGRYLQRLLEREFVALPS